MHATDMIFLLSRRNMVHRRTEAWRPPLFERPDNARRRLLAALRRFLDLQAGSIWRDLRILLPRVRGAVLDVGCGAQPYRPLFSREARYLGIDTVDSKTRFGYELPDAIYFAGDSWPVEDSSFDFVLCTETMEHVPVPDVLLKEVSRCLVPGGTVLLTVPFVARWHFIPYDYWRFTPSCLERLLANTGFSNIRVYARGNSVTVACYKVMALILRSLLPRNSSPLLCSVIRVISLPLVPVLLVLAALAHVSLWGDGGDDCLGYTVLADRRST
jgi:SAM-dependent methyltransferase